MIQLHNTKYFVINFDKEKELFHYVFHKTTELMTSDEYVAELQVFTDLVKEHKPKRVLGDMVDFSFSINPEIQEWINSNLFEVYRQIGFKKIAILLSQGYIESLSIEQTMEEETTNSFETSYFKDAETAMHWLLA